MTASEINGSKFVVMLARQRSGTNALQSVLDTHPDIDCAREVFHAEPDAYEHLDSEQNWFKFLELRGTAGILEILTSPSGPQRVFSDFLRHLHSQRPKRYLLLDIKYNSTHHLDGPWRDLRAEPKLFGFIRKHDLPVLQLRRRNYLRAYVSLITAERTGEWLAGRDGPERGAETFTIPPAQLLRVLRRSSEEDELVAQSFPSEKRLTLEYEELFPELGGLASVAELRRLARWLGIPERFQQSPPAYRKQSVRPLPELIENWDEVAAALRGTEFEYCLRDEAPYRAAARA